MLVFVNRAEPEILDVVLHSSEVQTVSQGLVVDQSLG